MYGYNSTIIPLHGTMSQVYCSLCLATFEFDAEILAAFKEGNDYQCQACFLSERTSAHSVRRSERIRENQQVGYLRPDIVLYGEDHRHGEYIKDCATKDTSRDVDLVLVIGTSLKVDGFTKLLKDMKSRLMARKRRRKVRFIYINKYKCDEG